MALFRINNETCLHPEEGELDIHVDEVGHEGYLGDGSPPTPAEEVVDEASKTTTAGKDEPEETASPHEMGR